MKKKFACCFPCVHAIVKCFHCTDKIYLAKEPINKIIDNLYLGDFRAADNPELLRSLNITHIINCAFNLPCKYKEQFTYLHLKLRDEPDQIIFPQIENAYEFIKQNSSVNILVHCVHGMSRSGSVIIYYLMKEKGMNMEESINYIGKLRAIINPNEGFRNQLLNKEKEIFNHQPLNNESNDESKNE